MIDCLNDRKLAKKGQCLEDYYRRFEYVESLRKIVTESAECWCVRMSSSIFQLNQTYLMMKHGLGVQPGNQVPEQSVKVFNVTEAKESKTVEVNQVIWSHSSVWEALCTVNSYHWVRGSMSTSIRISCNTWSVCEKRWKLRQDNLRLFHHKCVCSQWTFVNSWLRGTLLF